MHRHDITFQEQIRIVDFPRTGNIAWHTPITSWRERYGAYFRSVRYAGALELLRKEPLEEGLKPMVQGLFVIDIAVCFPGKEKNLLGSEPASEKTIQEEVMQFVRPHKVFCLLLYLTVLIGRNQFRANRSISYVQKHFGGFAGETVS